jgi:thiamine kinase-like enzyme
MNVKPRGPISLQVPKWWHHSGQSWIDLGEFFPAEQITNQAYWQKLPQGQTNYNYQLTLSKPLSKQNYFVQVVNTANIDLLPQCQLPQQPILQHLACFPSIKPWLVECYLNTPSIRVFQWFETENTPTNLVTADCAKLTDSAQTGSEQTAYLSSVSEFITQLHSIEISSEQREQLPNIDIQQHLRRYYRLALNHSPQDIKQIEMLFQHAQQTAQDFVASGLCHNDLSVNNLLWNGALSRLKVIDWEYACYSDPVMDLAGLLLNLHLNEQQQRDLIKHYSSRLDVEIRPEKLVKMKQLCQNISVLWHFCSKKE